MSTPYEQGQLLEKALEHLALYRTHGHQTEKLQAIECLRRLTKQLDHTSAVPDVIRVTEENPRLNGRTFKILLTVWRKPHVFRVRWGPIGQTGEREPCVFCGDRFSEALDNAPCPQRKD